MLDNVNLLELEGAFTLPSTRSAVRKEEKYNFPVLTINAIDPDKKGAGRKISLNKAAIKELGYDLENESNTIAFKFSEDRIFVINSTDFDILNTFKLTKTGTFSNKNVYEYLSKRFEVKDTSVDTDLSISILDTVENSPAGGLLQSMEIVDQEANKEEDVTFIGQHPDDEEQLVTVDESAEQEVESVSWNN